jgi:hypothetical protein
MMPAEIDTLCLEDLSVCELIRLHQTIERRYRKRYGSGLVALGFGRRIQDLKLVRKRTLVLRVCLTSKRKRVRKSDLVPITDEVRLLREHRFWRVCFETDVHKISKSFKTQSVGNVGDGKLFTAKILIRWRTQPAEAWHWGVLTVGHGDFQIGDRPTIQLTTHNHVTELVCKSRQPIDAAVFEILLPQELEDIGITTINPPAPGITLFDGLIGLGGVTSVSTLKGETWRESAKVPYRSRTYYPSFTFSVGGDTNTMVLEVESRSDTFPPSTSGSPWSVQTNADDQLGWVQLGTLSGTDLDFNIGLGQHIGPIVEWAIEQLHATELVVVKYDFDLPG